MPRHRQYKPEAFQSLFNQPCVSLMCIASCCFLLSFNLNSAAMLIMIDDLDDLSDLDKRNHRMP
jgi:hypothetical protein